MRFQILLCSGVLSFLLVVLLLLLFRLFSSDSSQSPLFSCFVTSTDGSSLLLDNPFNYHVHLLIVLEMDSLASRIILKRECFGRQEYDHQGLDFFVLGITHSEAFCAGYTWRYIS